MTCSRTNRRRGLAIQCMGYVITHLRSAEFASVTLAEGSGGDRSTSVSVFAPSPHAVSRIRFASFVGCAEPLG